MRDTLTLGSHYAGEVEAYYHHATQRVEPSQILQFRILKTTIIISDRTI